MFSLSGHPSQRYDNETRFDGRRKFMRLGSLFILGLALTVFAGQSAWADLVSNGNFATGDFTGWDNSDGSIVIDRAFAPVGDTYDAAFTGDGILSQNLATTASQEYTLSFSLFDEAGFVLDTFTVNFGAFSATITGDAAADPYQTAVFDILGSDITTATTTLSFQGFNALSADWNLDDVSVVPVSIVTAVPEPATGAILAGAMLMVVVFRHGGRMIRG
jgi:hypothetical protein